MNVYINIKFIFMFMTMLLFYSCFPSSTSNIKLESKKEIILYSVVVYRNGEEFFHTPKIFNRWYINISHRTDVNAIIIEDLKNKDIYIINITGTLNYIWSYREIEEIGDVK